MLSKPRQLSVMGMWPAVVHRANATALQPVRTTRCNLVSATLSDLVRSCQILSDLVRFCHTHTGLVCLSKSSPFGLSDACAVSYQLKGGPVTFEFLGATIDMG